MKKKKEYIKILVKYLWSMLRHLDEWVTCTSPQQPQKTMPEGPLITAAIPSTQLLITLLNIKQKERRSSSIWQFSPVQSSHLVVTNSLRPHGWQHARLPCSSPTPRACSNSCPVSRWHHSTISSSVIPFSHLQLFPASGSFLMSQFFTSGGQSIGALWMVIENQYLLSEANPG